MFVYQPASGSNDLNVEAFAILIVAAIDPRLVTMCSDRLAVVLRFEVIMLDMSELDLVIQGTQRFDLCSLLLPLDLAANRCKIRCRESAHEGHD